MAGTQPPRGVPMRISRVFDHRERLLQDPDLRSIPYRIHLCHRHLQRQDDGAANQHILRRSRQQECASDDMDICPCRGIRSHSKRDRSHRHDSQPGPAHPSRTPALCRTLPCIMLHFHVHRNQRRNDSGIGPRRSRNR